MNKVYFSRTFKHSVNKILPYSYLLFPIFLTGKRNFIYSQFSTTQQNNRESKGKFALVYNCAHTSTAIPHEDKSRGLEKKYINKSTVCASNVAFSKEKIHFIQLNSKGEIHVQIQADLWVKDQRKYLLEIYLYRNNLKTYGDFIYLGTTHKV